MVWLFTRLSQWGGGVNLLVQMISICCHGLRGRGKGDGTMWFGPILFNSCPALPSTLLYDYFPPGTLSFPILVCLHTCSILHFTWELSFEEWKNFKKISVKKYNFRILFLYTYFWCAFSNWEYTPRTSQDAGRELNLGGWDLLCGSTRSKLVTHYFHAKMVVSEEADQLL